MKAHFIFIIIMTILKCDILIMIVFCGQNGFSLDDTDVLGKDKLTLVFRKRSRHWCYIRNAVKIMMIHKKLQFYININ